MNLYTVLGFFVLTLTARFNSAECSSMQGRRSVFLRGVAENERRRCEFVGRSEGSLPQKILKSKGSEIVFTAFSARYFLK